MGVLSQDELKKRLSDPADRGLVVTPLLSQDQVGESSIDIRLGNEFIVMQRADLSHLELLGREWDFAHDLNRYQRKVRRRFREKFVLHPQEFVLGGSLEFVSMPNCLYSQVLGKSTLGRVGLIVATATGVGPGYKGIITLELCNVGSVPIELFPGMLIAQMVFFELSGTAAYRGRYLSATGPQFAVLDNKERAFWQSP